MPGLIRTQSVIDISLFSGGFYPNKPTGWTNTSEYDFSQAVPSPPEDVDRRIGTTDFMMWGGGFSTNYTLQSDATAPQSPSSIYRAHWAAGDFSGPGGHGLGNIFTRGHPLNQFIATPTPRIYISVRMYFDYPSGQADWQPVSNKFINIECNTGQILVQLYEQGNYRHCEELNNAGSFFVDGGQNQPGETHIPGQLTNPVVPTNQWVHLEFVIDIPNHIFKVWQNGVLTTSATPTFVASSMVTIGFNAFRGGGGEVLVDNLNWLYDHIHVAW